MANSALSCLTQPEPQQLPKTTELIHQLFVKTHSPTILRWSGTCLSQEDLRWGQPQPQETHWCQLQCLIHRRVVEVFQQSLQEILSQGFEMGFSEFRICRANNDLIRHLINYTMKLILLVNYTRTWFSINIKIEQLWKAFNLFFSHGKFLTH